MLWKWEDRARQLIDYSNLSWGVIHPTDIDGIMEFNGTKLVLLEYKTSGKAVDIGQLLLLERLSTNWKKAREGNASIVVIADHYTTANEIVDGGNCKVRKLYYDGRWYDYSHTNRTVRDVVEAFCMKELQGKLSNGKK